MKELPEVLFVCVHNAGRSQMAGGLVKLRSEGRVHVRSAGSDPGEEINPAVVEAMAELGVDMTEEFPKPLTDEVVRAADVVITMGCGDACPIYPGKRYEDWDLEDPAGQRSRDGAADPRRDRQPGAAAPGRAAKGLRSRRDPAQLALRLSMTAALGGVAFLVIGAWLAALIAFGAGLACAAGSYLLSRR